MNLKSLPFLLIVFLIGSITVQAQNPYKEFGIEVKPLTLSKGKYIEFFTNDSLVRIGSIILDTRNNRISSFVQRDTMYSEANLEPEVSSRFLSPDPYAAKYPNLSPYTYVANNPLNAIDPDGRLIIFINGLHLNNAGRSYWDTRSSFWERPFDMRVMNHLNDYNAIYRDGALGGWVNTLNRHGAPNNLSASNRYDAGYERAMQDFDAITAKLAPEETIKIITHSMGSMYGRGYVAALKKLIRSSSDPAIRAIQIDFIADFAPFQPTAYDAISGEGIGPTLQFSHCGDFFARCELSPGAIPQNIEDDENKGHFLIEFLDQIKNLSPGRYQLIDGEWVPINEENNKK